MEEKRHGGAGRVIVVILILAVLLAAGAFFLFGGRVRVETPSFSTGYRYDREKDYSTLDTFPAEGVTAEKVELHWISGQIEIRAAETISVSENFAGDDSAGGWTAIRSSCSHAPPARRSCRRKRSPSRSRRRPCSRSIPSRQTAP